MDLQGIRDALHKLPFEPFDIRFTDGLSFSVRHPDFVAVGKRRIIVVKPDDSWLSIEPLLIVSLDYNGKRSSRTKRHKKDTS